MSDRSGTDPRTKLLLTGPVLPTLLRLALPNVVVMVVQSSIGLIETYFVAQLGLDALAGMALAFPVLMTLQTVSAGAIGGGILSAVARALGANRRDQAIAVVWAAVAITVGLGLATTAAMLLFGPRLYALMGGQGGSLQAALAYSNIVFCGAVPLWLFNSLAAVIRGTGNMILPASMTVAGAVVLIPLSPALIFGIGPIPALGIAGGAVAIVLYYVVGCLIFGWYLRSGRGVLKVDAWPRSLGMAAARNILRIGLASAVVSISNNITIITATGLAGLIGPAAVAGYGTGVRVEYLLIPLVFGIGAPMSAMVGTAVGARLPQRALAVAWRGAALAGVITEAIGLAVALMPERWLLLFGNDPAMLSVGASYLRIVGPAYGFFGAGLALYFASQGAGRIRWPMIFGILRVILAAGGSWMAIQVLGLGSSALFAILSAAMVVFGLANAMALRFGAWSSKTGV